MSAIVLNERTAEVSPRFKARIAGVFLGAFFIREGETLGIGGSFFAIGSWLFSVLLLRGRMIPLSIAWLGVVASVLVVVALPLQLAGFIRSGMLIWMPMLVFELTLAFWFLIKGVAAPVSRRVAA